MLIEGVWKDSTGMPTRPLTIQNIMLSLTRSLRCCSVPDKVCYYLCYIWQAAWKTDLKAFLNLATILAVVTSPFEQIGTSIIPQCPTSPYKPSVLFMGHRHTVQTQIRHRIMWCLIRIFTVCLQNVLLKFE